MLDSALIVPYEPPARGCELPQVWGRMAMACVQLVQLIRVDIIEATDRGVNGKSAPGAYGLVMCWPAGWGTGAGSGTSGMTIHPMM